MKGKQSQGTARPRNDRELLVGGTFKHNERSWAAMAEAQESLRTDGRDTENETKVKQERRRERETSKEIWKQCCIITMHMPSTVRVREASTEMSRVLLG